MVFKAINADLEGMMLAKPVVVEESSGALKVLKRSRLTDSVVNDIRRTGHQGVYVDCEGLAGQEEPLGNMLARQIYAFLDKIYVLSRKRDVYDRIGSAMGYISDHICNDSSLLSVIIDLLAYDAYTYGHCINVAALSMSIGLGIALSGKELGALGMAGILHDIGKENVPVQIITKPGRLNDQEFAIVKEHPIIGFDFARRHDLPMDICLGILGHHEKYDGKGYPYGLLGDQISLYARILAIADVFDALTHRRSYHEPLSAEESLNIMESGNAFDGYLFKKFKDTILGQGR